MEAALGAWIVHVQPQIQWILISISLLQWQSALLLSGASVMLLSFVVQNWMKRVSQVLSLGAALKPGENLGHLTLFSLSKTHIS